VIEKVKRGAGVRSAQMGVGRVLGDSGCKVYGGSITQIEDSLRGE